MNVIAALMKGDAVEWPQGVDAREFLAACDRHGATPLVASRLAGLESLARIHAAHEVVRRREVDSLLERFERARIPLLVFKGEALARTHYRDPALRPRCDTDVLIERERMDDAARVLAEAGYREEPNSGGETISRQRIWTRTAALGIRHSIDLHWALSNRARYAGAFSFGELWSRGVALHGAHVRMPSESDALLIAALHLAAHHRGDERLIWIYDIHLLRGAMSEEVRAMARERGIEEALDRALALAERWFGDGNAVAARRGSAVRDFVDDLRFTRGARGKLRLLREHLLPPGDYVLRKYGATSRAMLPLLYVRRAVAGSARLLLR